MLVDPVRLVESAEETQAEVHKLGTRLQQVVEARTSAVTDTVVASLGHLRSEISGETKAVVAGFDAQLASVTKRQQVVLVLVVIAVLLASFAAADVILR